MSGWLKGEVIRFKTWRLWRRELSHWRTVINTWGLGHETSEIAIAMYAHHHMAEQLKKAYWAVTTPTRHTERESWPTTGPLPKPPPETPIERPTEHTSPSEPNVVEVE